MTGGSSSLPDLNSVAPARDSITGIVRGELAVGNENMGLYTLCRVRIAHYLGECGCLLR